MLRRLLLVILCVIACLGSAGPEQRRAGPPRLQVPVLASADVALSRAALKATVNGAEAKVLALARPADELILLVVLDLSGDLTLAQSATSAFLEALDNLPPNVYVGLLRGHDSLRVLEDPTRDRERIRKAVESLPLTGRAGLLPSIEPVASIASTMLARSSVRVAVLYLTDSEVSNYREDFTNPVINSSDAGDLSRRFPEVLIQEKMAKVDANLAATRAPVFIVHTSYRSDRLNAAHLDGIAQLALTTGGTSTVCRSLAEIPGAVRDTLDAIRTHYLVTLEIPPNASGKSADVRLETPGAPQTKITWRSRFSLRNRN